MYLYSLLSSFCSVFCDQEWLWWDSVAEIYSMFPKKCPNFSSGSKALSIHTLNMMAAVAELQRGASRELPCDEQLPDTGWLLQVPAGSHHTARTGAYSPAQCLLQLFVPSEGQDSSLSLSSLLGCWVVLWF